MTARSVGAAPTGRQFRIRRGRQRAVVTEVGAALRRYQVDGDDVIMPFGRHELPPAVHGAVLLPWPNRLGNGSYDFDGASYRLPLTEPERDNANHGLVLHTRWQAVDIRSDAVSLQVDLVPRQGYPFLLSSRIDYRLDEHGLEVRLRTRNQGERTAPYGVGFHPWLSPGDASIDECGLQIDADTWVETDDRLLPVRETQIPAHLDFRRPRRLGPTVIDDGFVDLTSEDSSVRLIRPDGSQAVCSARDGVRCWQVCTGDGMPGGRSRRGLAAEPMTCTANAMQTGHRLLRLTPGEEHRTGYALTLLPAGPPRTP
ncbi:aldose 1-epimerase [Austwickia chelonae]|uniref:Putative aldose 1-epimerase n=1 Tax=Austwickia chelonae NBRC 105200 TaxID=1184607 RepID=K6V3A6_9MICO|nr:aldose 1-epimerase family protein [Austwickia chelonae]GAB76523.1 putative aldose 1-epimerase [Austwickia chelonae NBRC 105200]SEW26157.1 aldose 1-epimerase [Austwickia chelonae]